VPDRPAPKAQLGVQPDADDSAESGGDLERLCRIGTGPHLHDLESSTILGDVPDV
jgi:hypothetical protein